MLDRIIGVFARVKVLPYLAALGAFGVASSASAETILFDFDDEPLCTGEGDGCFDPEFEESFGIESTFIVSHFGDPDSTALVEWIQPEEDGEVQLYSHLGGSAGGRMVFSDPVDSISLCLRYEGGDNATINPIFDDGVTGESEIPIDEGVVCLETLEFSEPGPYYGLRFSVPVGGALVWDDLEVTFGEEGPGYEPDATSIRGITTETSDGASTIIQVNTLQMVASEVIQTGVTDFDTCVARDVREHIKPNGTSVYTRRSLHASEVSGYGTCTGNLENPWTDSDGVEVNTWEVLLTRIDFVIPPWYRTFRGTLAGHGDGFWFVISSVRTTAEFRGANRVVVIPEDFPGLEFDHALGDDELECDLALKWRPHSLAVLAEDLDEWPNVERNLAINSTYQCNRPATLTRRTQHMAPFRADSLIFSEKDGVIFQLAGLGATLIESGSCATGVNANNVKSMKARVVLATAGALLGQWTKVRTQLQGIATTLAITEFDDDAECNHKNYSGNIGPRVVTLDFTIFDRIQHATGTWVIYHPQGAMADIVPFVD